MKNLISKYTFVFFLILSGLNFAQMNSTEIKKLKENINSATSNLTSLQSDFTQTKHLDFMENDVKSSGKLYFKSKSKIRWEYTSPFHYYVIRSEEHTSELQSRENLVCRLLLEKK